MRSMTGFGKAQSINKNIEVEIEVRSVNSRYLDLSIRLPNTISAFEMPIRDKIKEEVIRGKITVYVNLKISSYDESQTLIDNSKILERYNQLKSVKKLLKIDENIKLSHLLTVSDLFELDLNTIDEKKLLDIIMKTLDQALNAFNVMRDTEGSHILKDMLERNNNITELLAFVEKKSKLNVQQEFNRQLENVKNMITQDKIDQDRLNMEIALIADRVDITEECVRMRSHISLFENSCKQNGESGKKLNFILQEMLREANTMSSKTSDIDVSHKVIKIKEEIEKLREQAQNIE
jgi:uncharacterized protein (TIGR00255 family)